jgi:hypothetical protein
VRDQENEYAEQFCVSVFGSGNEVNCWRIEKNHVSTVANDGYLFVCTCTVSEPVTFPVICDMLDKKTQRRLKF